MSARSVSKAPDLPGFTFIEVIGSGGYADVFLYEQAMPRRQVAVKVLDADALENGSTTASDYTEEANVMAMVSAHPYIVQVFQADISPDGRPYLVMEYYPGKNFQQRAKQEQMTVAEVLRVGIQIGSAVETAHVAGILHRDIKPANILTSEYRRPGLTDFGIAAIEGPQSNTSDDGLSIPWSPPEAFGGALTNRRSDVYSLAATLYTMLAGRSPFEIKSGDNRPLALMNRIERQAVPTTGRGDVSSQLERVLAGAMSKLPEHRPGSMVDFARQLQGVESSLQLPVTPLELADTGKIVRTRRDDADDDATRVKGVVEVDAQPTPGHLSQSGPSPRPVPISEVAARPVDGWQVEPRRREGLLAEPEVEDTIARPASAEVEPEQYQPTPKTPKTWYVVGGLGVAIAVVVGGFILAGGGEAEPEDNDVVAAVEVNDNFGNPQAGGPVAVTPNALPEVVGEDLGNGRYRFSWDAQGSGAVYAVRVGDRTSTEEVDEPEFESTERCIEVEVIAESGLISAPTKGCAP